MITKSLTVLLKKILAVLGAVLIAILLSVDKSVKCSTKHHEVVFISSSVMRTEEIVDDLPHHTDIVYLVDDTKGLWEITDYLSYQNDIDAIRIISHGNAGHIVLNGELIDAEYIARRHEWVESWGGALSEDADIMLYGCNVAATAEGRALVQQISDLTGADVAASTDMTGGTGNWDLEFQTGNIEVASFTVDGYRHHLAIYTVTEISDDGTGDDDTLSWAINQSNTSTAVDDTIAFNLSSESTVTILAALPTITDSVTIDGDDDGTDVTVRVKSIGADGSTFRVFHINASGQTINISNMTIQGGDISRESGAADSCGGGIYMAAGTLALNKVTVASSVAKNGGGIYNNGAATISSSTVSRNIANQKGGGVYNSEGGTLNLTDSTISSNTAASGGGGIYARDNSEIHNSTISGNAAGTDGGGVYFSKSLDADKEHTISNSTISGNTASNNGGGIHNNASSYLGTFTQTITINNTTISGNRATDLGGGIYNTDEGNDIAALNIKNTIIADNYRGSDTDTGDDYYYASGTLTDNGYNVVKYQSGVSTGPNKTFTATTDILYNTNTGGTIDPQHWNQNNGDIDGSLGLSGTLALNDSTNGTYTLALAEDSFAAASATTGISAGEDNWNGSPLIDEEYTDQRGVVRTALQNTSIGAYSANYDVPPTVLATTTPTSYDCSVTKVEMHNGTSPLCQ